MSNQGTNFKAYLPRMWQYMNNPRCNRIAVNLR
jgi:hypothetical protein